jgi:hypothetical protein
MKTYVSKIRWAAPVLAAMLAILVATACRSTQSFQHYSTLFEAPLRGAPKQIPDSRMRVSLVTVDLEQNRAFFRLEHLDTNESTEEWVTTGDFFKSGFGSRGLRVAALDDKSAKLQRYGVR